VPGIVLIDFYIIETAIEHERADGLALIFADLEKDRSARL
jgi:hypothetical protein